MLWKCFLISSTLDDERQLLQLINRLQPAWLKFIRYQWRNEQISRTDKGIIINETLSFPSLCMRWLHFITKGFIRSESGFKPKLWAHNAIIRGSFSNLRELVSEPQRIVTVIIGLTIQVITVKHTFKCKTVGMPWLSISYIANHWNSLYQAK